MAAVIHDIPQSTEKNRFAADVPQYNELVEGDFHGNFHTFRAT